MRTQRRRPDRLRLTHNQRLESGAPRSQFIDYAFEPADAQEHDTLHPIIRFLEVGTVIQIGIKVLSNGEINKGAKRWATFGIFAPTGAVTKFQFTDRSSNSGPST